jgi:arsenite methyltransferase
MSEIDWDTPESAESYDQNCNHQFQKGQTLIEMMKIKSGDSVLDIGCGTGWQAVNVSEIIGPSGKLTCIDPSSYRIELSRKKFSVDSLNSVRFIVGQAEDLSAIPDNSINHAYFCSSFHWIDNKKTALNETYRVLQPGGSVGMTTLDRDSPDMMRTLVDPVLAKYNITRSYELHRGITRVNVLELQNLLSETGFTSISIEPRTIPRQHRSPEEFLKHLEEKDSLKSLLIGIPYEIKKKIKQEIYEELAKIKTPAFDEFGIVTLFAIATKPTGNANRIYTFDKSL